MVQTCTEMDSRSAPAHSKLPAVEDGPHLGVDHCSIFFSLSYVLSKLARAQGGVRPHRGITVIPTCGAAPTPVMPQVRRTWGRAESREKPQVEP